MLRVTRMTDSQIITQSGLFFCCGIIFLNLLFVEPVLNSKYEILRRWVAITTSLEVTRVTEQP